MMEEKKETEQELPKYSDIAEELKNMGTNLKEAFKAATESERAKDLLKQAQDVFDSFINVVEKFGRSIKSGQLERDARTGLHQTLCDLNRKLEDYTESAKSQEKEEQQNS